jgi:hypothetical protein
LSAYRHSNGVSVGERFGIFRGGEALIDPSTGTDFGTPDRQVGVVLVKIVRPKYAVGEIVSGEVPQRNDIARPEKQGANPLRLLPLARCDAC